MTLRMSTLRGSAWCASTQGNLTAHRIKKLPALRTDCGPATCPCGLESVRIWAPVGQFVRCDNPLAYILLNNSHPLCAYGLWRPPRQVRLHVWRWFWRQVASAVLASLNRNNHTLIFDPSFKPLDSRKYSLNGALLNWRCGYQLFWCTLNRRCTCPNHYCLNPL